MNEGYAGYVFQKLKSTKSKKWMSAQFLSHYHTYLFIYLGFYVAFNTVQVISRRAVGRAEETST